MNVEGKLSKRTKGTKEREKEQEERKMVGMQGGNMLNVQNMLIWKLQYSTKKLLIPLFMAVERPSPWKAVM